MQKVQRSNYSGSMGRLIAQKSIKFTPSYNLKEDTALLHNAINDCQKKKHRTIVENATTNKRHIFSHVVVM